MKPTLQQEFWVALVGVAGPLSTVYGLCGDFTDDVGLVLHLLATAGGLVWPLCLVLGLHSLVSERRGA